MAEFSVGLPNQALKPLVSTYQANVLQTKPFERYDTVGAVGAETNVFAPVTIESNRKVSIEDILVWASAGIDDAIFKVYRNGVCIAMYEVEAAESTERIPITLELNEGEILRVTAASATGAATVATTISGRSELKSNVLFSPVLA